MPMEAHSYLHLMVRTSKDSSRWSTFSTRPRWWEIKEVVALAYEITTPPVEGLAHSLVWSSKRGLEDAQHQPCVELCDISRVELPRLGVSFNAIESGGSIRLECEEHARFVFSA